jgi:hypothetical protein
MIWSEKSGSSERADQHTSMETWQVGAVANGIITVGYLLIGVTIARGLAASRQLRTNRLGLATACIFISCGLGHGAHLVHIIDEASAGLASQMTLRQVYDWHIVAVDVMTAGVAIWYWSLRSQYRRLLRGTALFEDIDGARRRAVELHDEVVQELATARYALDLGEAQRGRAALDRAFDRATDIVNDQLRPGPHPAGTHDG